MNREDYSQVHLLDNQQFQKLHKSLRPMYHTNFFLVAQTSSSVIVFNNLRRYIESFPSILRFH
jgi:hypothetical protein